MCQYVFLIILFFFFMDGKNQNKRIGYSPSEEAEKNIENFVTQNSLLSKSQLVDAAVLFFFRQSEEVIDDFLLKLIRGKRLEESKKGHLRKAA